MVTVMTGYEGEGLPEAGNVVSNQGANYAVRLLSEIRHALYTCDLYTLL